MEAVAAHRKRRECLSARRSSINTRPRAHYHSSSSSPCAIPKASCPDTDSRHTAPRSPSTVPLPRLPPHPPGALSACGNRLDNDGDTAVSFTIGQPGAFAAAAAAATGGDSMMRSTIDRALSRSLSTSAPPGSGRLLRRASNQAFFASRTRPREAGDSSYRQRSEKMGAAFVGKGQPRRERKPSSLVVSAPKKQAPSQRSTYNGSPM